jgi:ribosomal protein L16 Arg81 hydroxylase|tara:strand:+ start:1023 stop:1415 length:393 start_codon:yes stop_codon:yes gene_type:complete
MKVEGKVEHPAFVNGASDKGKEPCGGPTHFDDYNNFALVVCGSKKFYVAAHSTFKNMPIRGMESNQRLGVNPFNACTFAPMGSPFAVDETKINEWAYASLQSGDILYVPKTYWHWVQSTPRTIMTNDWIR